MAEDNPIKPRGSKYGNVPRTCLVCGTGFFSWPSQVKRGYARYCSKSCQVTDQHRNGVAIGARKGSAHHFWKGGRYIDGNGYVRVLVGAKYVKEHILVAEKMIGRKLKKNECVHHKDQNRQNNAEDNLQVMTRSAHTKLHHELDPDMGRRSAAVRWGKQ